MKTIIVIGENNPAGIAERILARMIEKGIEHEVLTVDQAKERGIPVPPADYLEKMIARDSEEKELNKLIHSLRPCEFDASVQMIEDGKATVNILKKVKKLKFNSKGITGKQFKGKLRIKRF